MAEGAESTKVVTEEGATVTTVSSGTDAAAGAPVGDKGQIRYHFRGSW